MHLYSRISHNRKSFSMNTNEVVQLRSYEIFVYTDFVARLAKNLLSFYKFCKAKTKQLVFSKVKYFIQPGDL